MRLITSLFEKYTEFVRHRRIKRLIDLETELGEFTTWGSGLYGTSNPLQRMKQSEYWHLRKKLGLPIK